MDAYDTYQEGRRFEEIANYWLNVCSLYESGVFCSLYLYSQPDAKTPVAE